MRPDAIATCDVSLDRIGVGSNSIWPSTMSELTESQEHVWIRMGYDDADSGKRFSSSIPSISDAPIPFIHFRLVLWKNEREMEDEGETEQRVLFVRTYFLPDVILKCLQIGSGDLSRLTQCR